jgi:hypothetical protein
MVMASSTSQPTDDDKLAGLGKENPTTFEEDGRYLIIEQEVTLEFLRRRELQVPAGQTLSINYPEVQKEARRVFAQKYPEDAVRYTGRKTQISRRKEDSVTRQQSEESPRETDSVPRNPGGTRSVQGEVSNRPTTNAGSFEDDLKEGLPENPSTVIDPSYNRALDRSNPSKSVAADSGYQPDATSAASPSIEVDPEYQDALENQWASDLANSQAREHRNQKDAAEQEEGSLNDLLNKSPSGDYLPLVSDEGSPVGLSAAYDGLAYGAPGIETGGFGGGENGGQQSRELSIPEENKGQEQAGVPSNQQFRAPGTPQENEETTGRRPDSPKIKAVEQQIDQKQREIDRLKKRIEAYNKDFIDPLKRAARAAIFVDTAVAIETYMAFTSWWWWLTVIGAILDIGLVFPGILIFYGAGIVKGRVGKTVQKNLRKQEAVVKNMLDARKTLEQQILQLRQRYFQLIQESRNPKQPGQGPSTPGNSNRPPTAPFSGVGLAT